MAQGDLITPSVKATINGEAYSVTNLGFSASIGSPSFIQLSGHPARHKGGSVVKVADSEMVAALKSAAGAYTQPLPRSDCSIQIDDGSGGSLSFDGLLSTASIEKSWAKVEYNFSISHKMSNLDALDMFVYDPNPGGETKEIGYRFDPTSIKGDDCCADISAIVDYLVNANQSTVEATGTNLASLRAQLAKNGPIIPILKQLLGSTSAAWIGGEAIKANDAEAIRSYAAEYIADTLRQRSGSFLANLESLAKGLGLVLLPGNESDPYGRLLRYSSVYFGDSAVEIEKERLLNFKIGIGSPLLPTTSVTLIVPPANFARAVSASNTISYRYPENITITDVGASLSDSGPVWLTSEAPIPDTAIDPAALSEQLPIVYPDKVAQSALTMNKIVGELQKDGWSTPIYREWVKYVHDLQVRNTVSTYLSFPLSVDTTGIWPGKRIAVEGIVVGTVQSVEHRISIEGTGSSGEGVTNVQLSHCELLGA